MRQVAFRSSLQVELAGIVLLACLGFLVMKWLGGYSCNILEEGRES